MKTLFEFKVVEDKKLENGENAKVERFFAIQKANTRLRELAEVFHAKVQSSLVAEGVLTRQMLQKRLINDGGVLSDKEAKETAELYQSYYAQQREYQQLAVIDEKTRTPEQNKQIEDLITSLTEKSVLIQNFEMFQVALFNNTAEVIARNRHVSWWILHLSYEKNAKGVYEPFFGSGNHESKRDKYDDLADDEFCAKVISYFTELISMWYVGKGSTAQELQQVFDSLNKTDDKSEPVVEDKPTTS
jgi:hypothetical protein